MSDFPHVIDYIGLIEPRGQLIPAADFPALYEWVRKCAQQGRLKGKVKFSIPEHEHEFNKTRTENESRNTPC